jgi:hypothetical protein
MLAAARKPPKHALKIGFPRALKLGYGVFVIVSCPLWVIVPLPGGPGVLRSVVYHRFCCSRLHVSMTGVPHFAYHFFFLFLLRRVDFLHLCISFAAFLSLHSFFLKDVLRRLYCFVLNPPFPPDTITIICKQTQTSLRTSSHDRSAGQCNPPLTHFHILRAARPSTAVHTPVPWESNQLG